MRHTDFLRSCRLHAAALTVALLCLSCGMLPSERDYRAASKIATTEAYRDYLSKYPEGYLSEQIAYNLASRERTASAYRDFLAKYPKSKLADQAKWTITDLELQQDMDVEFARAGADILPLLKKYGLTRFSEPRLTKHVLAKWHAVSSEEEALLRMTVLEPIRGSKQVAQDSFTNFAGTPFTSFTEVGGTRHVAAMTGVYYVAFGGSFLYVDSADIDGRRYPALAATIGARGHFYKIEIDQASK